MSTTTDSTTADPTTTDSTTDDTTDEAEGPMHQIRRAFEDLESASRRLSETLDEYEAITDGATASTGTALSANATAGDRRALTDGGRSQGAD